MKKPLYIAGFPGVGKTYYASHNKCTDSDSSKFAKGESWPRNYITHLKALEGIVLTSTHADVRDALAKAKMPFVLVYPDDRLKDDYMRRYTERGSPSSFLRMVDLKWNEWLTEMHNEGRAVAKYELMSGQTLSDINWEEARLRLLGLRQLETTTVRLYEYGYADELRRLVECFTGDQLQRQLDLLKAFFEERDLEKVERLYDALPDCPEVGCTEKEFVGFWISSISDGNWGTPPVYRYRTVRVDGLPTTYGE